MLKLKQNQSSGKIKSETSLQVKLKQNQSVGKVEQNQSEGKVETEPVCR